MSEAALAGTVGIVVKRATMKGAPKITVETPAGPNAKAGDSLAARADAEAGMPYSHPVKVPQPKTWNEFQTATKGQFSTRKEAGEAWKALSGQSQPKASAPTHKNSLDYVGETHV